MQARSQVARALPATAVRLEPQQALADSVDEHQVLPAIAIEICECDCLFLHVVRNPRESPLFRGRSEEHTSELQSLLRISYAVFCLKKKTQKHNNNSTRN